MEERRIHNLIKIEKIKERARRLIFLCTITKGVLLSRLRIEASETGDSRPKIVKDIVRKSELEEALMK